MSWDYWLRECSAHMTDFYMSTTSLNLDVLNSLPLDSKYLNLFQHPQTCVCFCVSCVSWWFHHSTSHLSWKYINNHPRILFILALSHSNLYPSAVTLTSEMFFKAFIICHLIFSTVFCHSLFCIISFSFLPLLFIPQIFI